MQVAEIATVKKTEFPEVLQPQQYFIVYILYLIIFEIRIEIGFNIVHSCLISSWDLRRSHFDRSEISA